MGAITNKQELIERLEFIDYLVIINTNPVYH